MSLGDLEKLKVEDFATGDRVTRVVRIKGVPSTLHGVVTNVNLEPNTRYPVQVLFDGFKFAFWNGLKELQKEKPNEPGRSEEG